MARAADQAVDAAKRAKNDRDAEDQLNAQAIELKRELNTSYKEAASAAAQLARTPGQRNAIERASLLHDQELQRVELQTANAKRLNDLGPNASPDAVAGVTEDNRERDLALQSVQAAQRALQAQQQLSPLGRFANDTNGSLGEDLQNNAVSAMQTLNSGLAEAIVNGKGLKAALKKALQGEEADLLKEGFKQAEGGLLRFAGVGQVPAAPGIPGDPSALASSAPGAGAFGSALGAFTSIFKLFGFADGTPSAPGGLAVVGERGPELMRVPRGSQVYSNAGLTALTRGLSARGGGNLQVSLQSTYDLRGVAGDRTIDAKIAAAHDATVGQILGVLPSVIPGLMAQHQLQAG